MSDRLFQVTYTAPLCGDSDESSTTNLRTVVHEFMREYADDRRAGIVCIQLSTIFDLFLVFLGSAEMAELLPLQFAGYERFAVPAEVELSELPVDTTMFYRAKES